MNDRLKVLAAASNPSPCLSLAHEMDLELCSDDQLFKELEQGSSFPCCVTPERPQTQITSDAAVLVTPASTSTRASTEASASSTPSPTPTPEEKKLPAPRSLFPGKFGKPGATESSMPLNPHPFRRALTSTSELSTAETPTKDDLDFMKKNILEAKSEIDKQQKPKKKQPAAAEDEEAPSS